MAASAETVGLAGWSLVNTLLEELEQTQPGIRRRVFTKAIADNEAEALSVPGGTATAIADLLKMITP